MLLTTSSLDKFSERTASISTGLSPTHNRFSRNLQKPRNFDCGTASTEVDKFTKHLLGRLWKFIDGEMPSEEFGGLHWLLTSFWWQQRRG
ncbi:hypothetical protein CUMW_167870 [Citrus unshiu]|uniref:Uncharacterized protein n=1 Tax=Citrus unshiu TaxID=55188 RepID=A0A2H5PUA9_CITUN|nr:hypothetical protein CUMW_167870 [Citrus unshiu]